MADAFLRELFRVQNRVQDNKEQTCIICMENCGIINPESGLAEFAIRLPCKHIVGSGCIAKWLHSNNTCPMCRYVFFPAQSRPHPEHNIQEHQRNPARPNPEHGIAQRQRDHVHASRTLTAREKIMCGPSSGITNYLREMKFLCDCLCTQLGLRSEIAHVATSVAANLLHPSPSNDILRNQGTRSILAVSIYIASIITRNPRCPREITAVMDDIDRHDIPATYALLTNWRSIIDQDVRSQLSRNFNCRTLILPPDRNELRARESDLNNVTTICSEYCDRLDSRTYVSAMARSIASRVWNIATFRHVCLSPRSIAAACVYMAGHLMGHPHSMVSIARVSYVKGPEIDTVYCLLFAERAQIVQEDWLRVIGKDNMRRALAMLPTV